MVDSSGRLAPFLVAGAVAVVVTLGAIGPVPAGGGSVLLFAAPARATAEAKRLNRLRYDGGAAVHLALPADEIFAEIERTGRAAPIAAVEILGHGLPLGPFITSDGGIKSPRDRLTVERLDEWVAKLRAKGVDPRKLFAPGARITIRACYVGKGELPKALLGILPADGSVESDFGFYKNSAAVGLTGGFWERKRVTTGKSDVVFRAGAEGPTDPYASLRPKKATADDFAGYWTGKAEVTKVTAADDAKVKSVSGATHDIKYGAFVITKREAGSETVLELEYQSNLLVGVPAGDECAFEPDGTRGGNMKGAHVRVEGARLTGTLIAASGDLYVERKLTLTKD